jgi:hypothetical protein
MSKNVTLNLGPTAGLSARQLTIRPHPEAGHDTIPVAAAFDSDVGAVETAIVNLADNEIWSAVLVDTMTAGEVRPPQSLIFNTGSLQYLGPEASSPNTSEFYVLHMEDLSSQSSSSSLSSSSLSSSSSASSSSLSSSSLSSSSSASSSSQSSSSSSSASSQS